MASPVSGLSEAQKKSLLQELESTHKEARYNQQEARRKWTKTERYVAGKQWNPLGTTLETELVGHEEAEMSDATGDVDKEFFISNEMKRTYLVDQQRMTAYYLRPDVIPPEKSATAKVAARASRIFLADHIRRMDPERMKAEHALHMIIHNFTCMKVHWDPRAGRSIRQPRKGLLGKLKGFMVGNTWAPEGEIKWDVINPRNLLFPKFTTNIEQADWVEEYRIVTTDFIFRRYGIVVEGENITPDTAAMLGQNIETRGPNSSEGATPNTDLKRKYVILKERWIKPNEQYEKGAIFTWCGTDHLLRASNLLDYYPGIPYFCANLVRDDRDIFGISILWDLIPLQNFVNRAITAGARWLKMISLLRRWIPTDANIDEDELDNATGMNTKFDGKQAPTWDEIPELNETIFKLLEMARSLISSYGYSNELAKTNRAFSGNALGILQEMDDTVFRPGLESMQGMYSRASDFTLRLAGRYIDTPRLVRMMNMQGWQMVEFKGSMITDDYHAEINLMTGLPSNKAMRLEFLKGLYKDGIMTKEEVKSHLEFATDNEALEQMQKQYEIAETRIEGLQNFQENYQQVWTEQEELTYVCTVKYHKFDNHALLVDKLQTAMQEGFDHWNPWVQLAFLEHYDYHKDQAAQAAAAQAQAAAAAGAAPAGGPAQAGSDTLLPLSNQGSEQQPPPDQIPTPLGKGMLGG